MDAKAHFHGKRITVMGLGLLGRGVGDARYLAECGAELIVTDLKTREELAESVAQLESFSNITFIFGEHRLEDFRDRDLILKAAGVPFDSPYIAEAKKHKIPVRMSADLFAEISKISIIGVTGTRGKSTVAHMVYAILKEAGRKAVLGGNVRGVSNLELLKEVTSEHTAVLELDSWQLQGWGDAKMSPYIAVFTTLYPDHLNYYGSTSLTTGTNNLDAYLADKANIFRFQKPADTLILGKQCAPTIIDTYGEQIESKTSIIDETKIPDTWVLKVPGMHNRYDAALALAAARAAGAPDETSRKALEVFVGVPGRLELVREVKGVKIYNDTTSTTPEATLAALSAFDPAHTILVMGGADKILDMEVLLARLPETKKVIALAGSGTERIKSQLPEGTVTYHSIFDATAAALCAAGLGDIVLLSPAFASFGMFKNEFDRGDQFNTLIRNIPDISLLKPKVRELAGRLITECERRGFAVVVSRAFRTSEEQDEFYAQGRTKSGAIITMAQGGSSFHNYGVAFDIKPIVTDGDEKTRAELYRKAGKIGMDLGLEWGGIWKEFVDPPHFQYTAGYSIEDFKNGRIEEEKFSL